MLQPTGGNWEEKEKRREGSESQIISLPEEKSYFEWEMLKTHLTCSSSEGQQNWELLGHQYE